MIDTSKLFIFKHIELVRVIDGDTLVFDIDLGLKIWAKNIHVRVWKYNAPEMNTPEGVIAKGKVEELMLGWKSFYDFMLASHNMDKYGRLLASVNWRTTSSGEQNDLSTMLLQVGIGQVMNA